MVRLLHSSWLLSTSLFIAQGQTPAAPVTPTAPTSTSVDVELLKAQIDFLKTANDSLASSFAQYVTTINLSLAIGGIAFGAITLLGGVLFGQNLWEFRRTLAGVNKEVEETVRQRVQQEVAVVVRNRVERLEAMLAREDLPGRMTVDYVLPVAQAQSDAQKTEQKIAQKGLERRGFRVFPKFLPELQQDDTAVKLPNFAADIVVLDLYNVQVEETEQIIQRVVSKVPKSKGVSIIHLSGRSARMDELTREGHYCSAANGPLTLVARVLEAAYVMDAINS